MDITSVTEPSKDPTSNLDGCASSNAAEFDALFLRYEQWCYVIALRITRNHFDAQDVVQLVFCKVWMLQPAPHLDSVKSWLTVVTRNAALDCRRKKEGDVSNLRYLYAHPVYGRSAEEEALTNLESIRAVGYLRGLPTDTRSLIHESFFERLSHSSIARRRHLPLGTVKTKIRSGLSSLRQMMGSDGRGPSLLFP
jgi:RNA polymerase sigma-70 factor (ECF subfamily)